MTLQPLDSPAIWPQWPFTFFEPTDFRPKTIDGADEYLALITGVPKTGNIRNVGFLTGTVTTGGTNDLDIRIETVDANGDPSGTLWGANTNVALDLQDSDDNTFLVTGNLTASAAVVRGDSLIAVKIKNPAANFATAQLMVMDQQLNQFPYTVESLGAGAVKSGFGAIMALQYDDGVYYPICGVWPFSVETRGVASSPEEDGAKFQVPFPCKVIGTEIWFESDADCSLVLRSDGSPGSILTSAAVDKDHRISAAGGRQFIYFDDEVELAANTVYRLLVDRGGASIGVHYFSTLNAALMNATPGGMNFIRTHGTGAGAFTDVNTEVPVMSLIISELDDGAGGGGGGGLLVHPGTSGGAQG